MKNACREYLSLFQMIHTLLGSPRKLICKCCGMPIRDSDLSREKDGLFNGEYCKWCYADGAHTLDIRKQYVDIGGKEKTKKTARAPNS